MTSPLPRVLHPAAAAVAPAVTPTLRPRTRVLPASYCCRKREPVLKYDLFLCPRNPGLPGGGRQAALRKGGGSRNEAAASSWAAGGCGAGLRVPLSQSGFETCLTAVSLRREPRSEAPRHAKLGWSRRGLVLRRGESGGKASSP